MIILTQYRILNKNGIFYAVSDTTCACPACGGTMRVRDSKRRHVILSDGEVQIFSLRRLKCMQCGTLHIELPDLIVPHKHYSRDAIHKALSGAVLNCPAENSTIYRWEKEF